jgi:hypothetical protein
MTSVTSGIKQNVNDIGYYVPVASLVGQIYGLNPTSNTFSTASWAYFGPGRSMSSINAAGAGILKDMGKTVVSSLRTFRKVQLVIPGSASTFGVGGRQSGAGEDYLTGYIELGFEGNGTPAPVAHYGR